MVRNFLEKIRKITRRTRIDWGKGNGGKGKDKNDKDEKGKQPVYTLKKN